MTTTSKPSYEDDMIESARRLYKSPLGRKVLIHWLDSMFFFSNTENEREALLKNFATAYMSNLGWNPDNADILTECILKLPKEKT